jgi:hypothetical protein
MKENKEKTTKIELFSTKEDANGPSQLFPGSAAKGTTLPAQESIKQKTEFGGGQYKS